MPSNGESFLLCFSSSAKVGGKSEKNFKTDTVRPVGKVFSALPLLLQPPEPQSFASWSSLAYPASGNPASWPRIHPFSRSCLRQSEKQGLVSPGCHSRSRSKATQRASEQRTRRGCGPPGPARQAGRLPGLIAPHC